MAGGLYSVIGIARCEQRRRGSPGSPSVWSFFFCSRHWRLAVTANAGSVFPPLSFLVRIAGGGMIQHFPALDKLESWLSPGSVLLIPSFHGDQICPEGYLEHTICLCGYLCFSAASGNVKKLCEYVE